MIACLIVASGAFIYALNGLMSNDSGWTSIEASSSAETNCGDDFIFQYYVGAAGVDATAERKALTLLYTDALVKAYEVFHNDEAFEGVNNIYEINQHPNEELTVDPVLYGAFETVAEYGRREIYLAPVYLEYKNLFFCNDDSETFHYDAEQNADVRTYFGEIAAYANDPSMVNVELLGDNRLKLHVSEEYLAYAKENVGTEAEVQTDGLRVRSDADENAAVITAVSTGTTLQVDTEAETDGDWVPVIYNGTTRYVSSDYVTLSLATGEGVTIEEEREEQERIAAEEAAKKASQVTEVTTVQNSAVTASTDEVTLLAAIIQCEAGNEIYEGQVAVGAVVMNRVRSGSYPSSIYDVIYQSGQFPPAGNGSVARIVANGPKATCIQAAQEAIGGADNTAGAMYFKRASSGHAGVVIGNHVFY